MPIPLELEDVLLELAERIEHQQSPPDFLRDSFPKQREFILDSSRMKAVNCTRRAGKSHGAALYLVKEAQALQGCRCLFVALTLESATNILWDILKRVDSDYALGMRFHQVTRTATLPNGSVIQLAGADTSPREMDKFLGTPLRLAIVDESAAFHVSLERLVYSVLKPTMTDLRGTIVLMGVPGLMARGLFFRATSGTEPGWSMHSWSALDNPHVAQQWAEELAEIDRVRPLFKETPEFKREYLAQWWTSKDLLVYRYNEERNSYTEFPIYARGEWSNVLSVDLGFNDDASFTLLSFHEHDANLYVRSSFKQPGLDITGVAERIKLAQGANPLDRIIIDGSNKQAVEEMRRRHGIPLIAAEKQGKAEFIELLNSDFIQGRVKIHALDCQPLVTELAGLIWKDEGLKRVEHPACPNHCCDGLLYGWRYCYPYLSTRLVEQPAMGTVARAEQEAVEMERSEEEALRQRQELERDPWTEADAWA